MTIDEIHVGSVISGPLLPEPVEVLAVVALGDSIKLIGKGCKTGLVRDPVLTPAQLSQLRCSPVHESFDVYLRRTKEALVSFPDPETGEVKKLFT